MKGNKLIFSGLKWTTANTIIVTIVAILKISILTRYLGKADFGLLAIIMIFLGFIDLFSDFGITTAIFHKQDISKKVYASLYWLGIIIGLFLYILLLCLSPLLSDFFNQPQLNQLIPLLGVNIFVSSIGRQFRIIEQKALIFNQVSIIEIVTSVISLVLAILLAVNNFGIYAIIVSSITQYLFNNILFLVIGLKKHGLLVYFRFEETKPFIKIGIYQVGGQLMNYFNKDLDLIIVGKLFSTEVLGGYSLAKQLVLRPLQIINPILIKIAVPTLALQQSNGNELKKVFLKLTNYVSIVNFTVYVNIIVFAPILISIMYGSEYSSISDIVRILSLYMFIRAIMSPVGTLLTATGRTDLDLKWNSLVLIAMPIFIYLGALGGIINLTISISLAMFLMIIPCWKLLISKLIDVTLLEYLKALFIPSTYFSAK